MSITEARLQRYYDAEARILEEGFSLQYEQRRLQEAELETIRKAIAALEQKLAREETRRAGKGGSLRYRRVAFDRDEDLA